MAVLKDFPLVSQLTTITSDGRPSEDAQFECVPASIGAGILWYQGKKQWDNDINPDKLKDAAYGESWKNAGTAASAYVPFCQSIGFKLYPINSNPADLVAKAHQYLAENKPVIFTEPDPYVPSSYGWSHVCCFYADAPNSLTALDPYIGKPVTHSDQEWANQLLFNQIWLLERMEEDVPIIMDMNNPVIAAFFTENQGQWQSKTTGKSMKGAILNFYQRYGNSAFCGLTYLGLPLSNEIPLDPQFPHCVKQYFERGVLCFDQAHIVANPPGSGEVYLLHLYGGDKAEGVDPMVTELQAQLAAAQKTDTTQLQADLTKYKTMAHQIALIVQGE